MNWMATRRQALAAVAGAAAMLGAPMAAAQEKPELVIAVDTLWATLEPMIGFSSSSYRFGQNIFDTLIATDFIADPEGSVNVPWLIESWTQDGTIWTLNVRDGVTWHNGQPLTAEDIAFTLSAERLWGEKPIAPRGRSFMRGTTRVEVTGPMTVEVETAFPDPVWIQRFAGQIGMVVPKDYAGMTPEQFGQTPVGTGPYRVTEFNSGDRLVMEAVENWWGGEVPVSKITWQIVPEPSARFAGLVSGEYDFIVSIPSDQEAVFAQYPDLTLIVRSITNYPMFAINTMITETEPDNPLADANLRKALVSAVDMEEIVDALFGDVTFVPAPFNFPEYGPHYFDPERRPTYGYDPERARALLAESGYNGEPLIWKITRGFFPNYELAAEIMVEQWAEVGINVQMAVVDNFNLAYERPFHLLNMSMGSDFSGDPMRPLWIDWGPGSNRAGAAHKTWVPTERFVELGEAFERELDLDKRRALYLEMVAEWEDVTPALYMWRNVLSWAHRKGIEWVPQNNSGMRFYGDYIRFTE